MQRYFNGNFDNQNTGEEGEENFGRKKYKKRRVKMGKTHEGGKNS